jgi:hypothetical protein
MSTWFKSPLIVYVLWHPEYADGALMAHKLFSVFSRNVGDPFARTPGIPVYFRSCQATPDSQVPGQIPFEEAEYTAIVVLVDDHMLVSDAWGQYVAALDQAAAESNAKVRLLPVAVNSNAFSFPIANTNFIRLFEVQAQQQSQRQVAVDRPVVETRQLAGRSEGITINLFINADTTQSFRLEHSIPEMQPADAGLKEAAPAPPHTAGDSPALGLVDSLFERKALFLIAKLVHELSRLLYQRPRVTEQGTVQSAPPVRMFISHAKADGADLAAAIRNHIHSDTSLKSFFDANDIAFGYRFSDELLAALQESAVICLQTDYYATREWCLWEVINAKRLDRPVVVVNAVTDREPRSFPYLGNVPTIRWNFNQVDDKVQIQHVLDLAMFEVLGTRFHELFQKALIKTFNLPDTTGVVGHPPELFTILKMAADGSQQGHSKDNPRYVVYPDPPLGDEEVRLLEDQAPGIRFVTPTMLPLVQHILRGNSHETIQ